MLRSTFNPGLALQPGPGLFHGVAQGWGGKGKQVELNTHDLVDRSIN